MTWDLPAVHRESRIEWQLWLAVADPCSWDPPSSFRRPAPPMPPRGCPGGGSAVGQVLATLLGIGLVAVLCLVDYSRLARWSLVAYWISIVLLLAVTLFGVSDWVLAAGSTLG